MNNRFAQGILLLLIATFMSANVAQAQMFLLEDVNGRPIKKGSYENVVGTPYLFQDWVKGSVTLGNGNLYENVPLRYDLVTGQLLFRTPEGQELEFVQPVQEFKFEGSPGTYRSGFAPVDSYTAASFYQVLEDGEVKLLKKSQKVVREEKAYGTATITKNLIEYTNYYLAQESQLVKVKNGKGLLDALPSHQAALSEYVKKNKLKLNDEHEMAQLVAYYNTLQ